MSSYVPSFVLRLRLEEGETRVSRVTPGRELITLKWSVVQQPEFGPIHDNIVTNSDNDFAIERVNQLMQAMHIPLDSSRVHDTEDLLARFLAKRRYVSAAIEWRDWASAGAWTVRRYFRTPR